MSNPSPSDVSSINLAERLRRVVGTFVRLTRSQTGTLKSAQSDTLDILARDGPLSVTELAGLRRVKHQSMRVVVGQLEADGAVRKVPHPQDGRSQLVTLTRSGKAVVTTGRRLRTSWIDKAIRETFTSDEIKCLASTLGSLEKLIRTFSLKE